MSPSEGQGRSRGSQGLALAIPDIPRSVLQMSRGAVSDKSASLSLWRLRHRLLVKRGLVIHQSKGKRECMARSQEELPSDSADALPAPGQCHLPSGPLFP